MTIEIVFDTLYRSLMHCDDVLKSEESLAGLRFRMPHFGQRQEIPPWPLLATKRV